MRRLKSAPTGPDAVPPQKKFLGMLFSMFSVVQCAVLNLLNYILFVVDLVYYYDVTLFLLIFVHAELICHFPHVRRKIFFYSIRVFSLKISFFLVSCIPQFV